jgi:carboxyl-terminal processing protease
MTGNRISPGFDPTDSENGEKGYKGCGKGMMQKANTVLPMLRRAFVVILVLSLSLGFWSAEAFEGKGYDTNRASLLGYMLKEQLGVHNFGQKNIDAAMSKDAFKLYLKQLDPQKRFLLQSDVKKLKAYSDKIAAEIQTGRIELPEMGAKVLAPRVSAVQKMIRESLQRDFDFSQDETIETDADKLDYCKTEKELKERWRKILKYEVLNQYLILVDDFKKETAEAQKVAREKVLKSYDELFSRVRKEKRSEQYDRYFSAIARTFDPHTDYFPPVSKEAFEVSMKGSFEGIGATLREESGYIKVESVMPGSPAFRQGQLQAGDTILKVAEGSGEPVDIFDMRITDAVKLIRGKKGTEVRLTVKKQDGTQLVIPIVRDVVQIEETFAKSTVLEDVTTGRDVGYIKLPGFYRDLSGDNHGGGGRNSTDDMRNEVQKLEARNIGGLILDLRHNGGGSLSDAVNIAGLFIGKGPIVQVKSRSGTMKTLSDEDPSIQYNGPLIILVDKLSASASEILTGALQDYGRAVVIGGEHTHGKGTVQMMVNLDNVIPFPNMDKFKPLGALYQTIQKFYRITGESTQYKGVVPDIVVAERLKCMKIGERYLDFALPWDRVEPVPYEKWIQQPDIKTLKSKSDERVRSSQDLLKIAKETERICEQQKKTIRSLNIDAVRKERSETGNEEKGFHGFPKGEKKAGDTTQLTEEDKKNLWTAEVGKDPYVREAMEVLRDMITAIRSESRSTVQ